MATTSPASEHLSGVIFSLLDTDLYKLTMQCAVLTYFSDIEVTYAFTNRTSDMKLSRAAFQWLETQIQMLSDIILTDEELDFLKLKCTYLNQPYLQYLGGFRFHPAKHIKISFSPWNNTGGSQDLGDMQLQVNGLWVDTMLYEIPLLALTSEAYFRFCDRDWKHDGQEELAYQKGKTLLTHGCVFSEFGTRRRRDYHTQELVLRGLQRADRQTDREEGQLSGTSNVHFAMRFGLLPVGTVAHEWFMGVAAISDAYEEASETALQYWVGTFGEGVLGIALTDTFGTPNFLKSFKSPIGPGTFAPSTLAPASSTSVAETLLNGTSPDSMEPSTHSPTCVESVTAPKTYAEVFTGVRQDSGDPAEFVKIMRRFYDDQGIKEKKTIIFSDSLNLELCLDYKRIAEASGFRPVFGVGTFLTNDFINTSNGRKSVPLNIVIKLSSAGGRPAVKISDNIGKNTGDSKTVESVKRRLGYVEEAWEGCDERKRWGGVDYNPVAKE